MKRRERMGVVPELPTGVRERAVVVIEVHVSCELIMVPNKKVRPAVTVKVSHYGSTVLRPRATPSAHSDPQRHVDEGVGAAGGKEKQKDEKECHFWMLSENLVGSRLACRSFDWGWECVALYRNSEQHARN